MQLFRAEALEQNEKVLPRAAQIATGIGSIYVGGTVIVALGYWIVGMSLFDAICHAMTTIATGGYANYDASFALPKLNLQFLTILDHLPKNASAMRQHLFEKKDSPAAPAKEVDDFAGL